MLFVSFVQRGGNVNLTAVITEGIIFFNENFCIKTIA